MPRLRRCFGYLLPTVQSLALKRPAGRPSISSELFQHPEGPKLLYYGIQFQKEPADGLTLVPPFVPPLRGRLTMTYFTRAGLLKPSYLGEFGPIRWNFLTCTVYGFCHMLVPKYWRRSGCIQSIFVVRSLSEGDRVLANDPTAKSSLGDLDLPPNKSLRTLEASACSVDGVLGGNSQETTSNLPDHALSTITFPVFFRIIVVFRDCDFRGVRSSCCVRVF